MGGCTHNSRHRQDVMSYNVVTREWGSLAPMLTPRSQMGITILDGYMYVVGGTSKNQEVLTSVERYSFEKVIYYMKLWYDMNLFAFFVLCYTNTQNLILTFWKKIFFSEILCFPYFRTNGALLRL